jgi:hypothetical protein
MLESLLIEISSQFTLQGGREWAPNTTLSTTHYENTQNLTTNKSTHCVFQSTDIRVTWILKMTRLVFLCCMEKSDFLRHKCLAVRIWAWRENKNVNVWDIWVESGTWRAGIPCLLWRPEALIERQKVSTTWEIRILSHLSRSIARCRHEFELRTAQSSHGV